MQKRLTLLGSTGSIGDSTLDVVARHPDRFSVYALSAHRNGDKLVEQCLRFKPEVAVVGDADTAARVAQKLRDAGCRTEVTYGKDALVEVSASDGCDTVVAAIVGAAGLAPSLAAARAGKRILLANKEALVMSGAIFMDAVRDHGAVLLPVDSEHNAIFQCLPREAALHGGVSKIILTASGGPFRTREPATLVDVTPDEACKHPNWVMGRKISVDSATMMNKGLEVIEAHWLFGLAGDRIDVLIHPQSVIHSLVSYADGSVLAQLGNPDMRTPIAHALAFPDRVDSGVAQLDLAQIATLSFEKPDYQRFPCLALAMKALAAGGIASASLNAANEVAVDAFLNRRIGFMAIAQTVETVLDRLANRSAASLDDVLDADALARRAAQTIIDSLPVPA
ncbi:1-deoxy-D-xylulose-5-phosphate reductoisomerase [Paraburkholderia caballeronis]|uniref:1-deoxy-D-xylulose 5-phosphate reductoisomerase n=1 Tax=Paraburkholderia caballeronis TaxID=416943 RepID=A0A1H7ND23_9BURK|nr:1-deoxy-D-xylulose-5-phosphate reductoisomerase [Paraburkholderia caballeronis]PXW26157.1 1-deoxy-D-xylulose 5-phosphate reductoisomerase [Paraburkholderia caballeronis]PXX01704.1 1-deoxy-D-xylulose 5-phosphate reductoisomerase [Paraburkholderia caballeronis]RAK00861.1 1-deoxy-D-xylulose 5-phosphate reductoisomerase [Paraburkholderia caballeronis]SEC11298.1 1-deoxy-D-xylulose 5-phosphate reductoisomerase [Paraburkholderia caballeronis]SEL21344.1 1-deoxy-D-xylulose 5-phosphate reductoisomera